MSTKELERLRGKAPKIAPKHLFAFAGEHLYIRLNASQWLRYEEA